jgi:hypothetical protein
MTKLVLVLAVVVVVILVVVIVAVRNMRAEDPDEFADQFDDRGRTRGSKGGRDPRYGSGRKPARAGQPARAAARSPRRQAADAYRPAGADRGSDDPHDQRPVDRRRGDTGPQRSDEGRAPARARRRSSDSSEWDSSEWDKLSDVDYWAELASDKPLTTTAKPAAQRAAERGSDGQARSRPDLERETLAAPGGRSGFAAPAPANGAAGRPRAGAESDDQRRRGQRHRQPASPDGDRARPDRGRAAAASNGDRGRPDRSRLAGTSGTERAPRLLDGAAGDRGGYLSAGPASLPLPAIRDVPPARADPPARPGPPRDVPARPDRSREMPARRDPLGDAPAARQDRPRPVYDDDPLTSPSFPRVPAADGRSYHSGRSAGPQRNGRPDTPPGGSRGRDPYLEPTQQFTSYGGPDGNYDASARNYDASARNYDASARNYDASARSYDASPGRYTAPAAGYDDPSRQHAVPQHPAPYAAGQHQAPPQPAAAHHLADRPAARHSAPHLANAGGEPNRATAHAHRPDPLTSQNPYPHPYESRGSSGSPGAAPAAPAGTSNPYGSYVTPDSQQTVASRYDSYPGTPGNGHQALYESAAPSGNGHNANGYGRQSPARDGSPGHYPDSAAQAGDPRGAAASEPGYLNGYGRPDQAGYLGNGYHAQAPDPAGYTPADSYGSDGYGGYPEYGAADR